MKNNLKRFGFFLLADAVLAFTGIFLSFLFIFGLNLFSMAHYMPAFFVSIPLKIGIFLIMGVYRITWRYVCLNDIFKIARGCLYSSLLTGYVLFITNNFHPFTFRALCLDFLIFLFSTAGLRMSKRLYFEILRRKKPANSKRTLIIGAGNMGELIVRNLIRNNFNPYYPVCFADDDKGKIGTYIQNVKVAGSLDALERLIENYQIAAIILAIPSLPFAKLKEIYLMATDKGIREIKTMPGGLFGKTKQGPAAAVKQLEDIKIEDILGRQEVKIETDRVREFVEGKTVMVTGSAGSIGSEIVEQICGFNPKILLLYEIDETELFYQENRLLEKFNNFGGKIVPIVGDVKDFIRLQSVFQRYSPRIIFHSAAYKHVPVMEKNASEAVKVNIFGTHNLCKLASEFRAEKFILISTDKAVNPTSVMGATKRFCEYLATNLHGGNSCQFVAVRFGNVLGSRGSVLPIFLEQIKNGGPVTITHPEMRRYFMTIKEAVALVLEASTIGKGGEVLVLDMGKPVNILNLAEDVIKLQGLEPYKDIEIKFIGLRAGEKFFEEILTAEEGTTATMYEKIHTAIISQKYSKEFLEEKMGRLRIYVNDGDGQAIIKTLKEVVTSYSPSEAQ